MWGLSNRFVLKGSEKSKWEFVLYCNNVHNFRIRVKHFCEGIKFTSLVPVKTEWACQTEKISPEHISEFVTFFLENYT